MLKKARGNVLDYNVREVGTLPEDTSRGVEAVKVPEKRNATCRYLGRLGGDKKNQVLYRLSTLLAAPGTSLFGTAYAIYLYYLSNSMVHKKLPKNAIIDEILAKKTSI